ncbi:hypothetical protein [Streptomyces sp. Tue6028]|uniref:hypothetical protein n=1 Tax=Streptomyces sp. Tue6028 TaxID=2036037 RepID=UPI003EBAB14B
MSENTEHSPVLNRRLGSTGMDVTPVGFGSRAVAGTDRRFGWGEPDATESVAAI